MIGISDTLKYSCNIELIANLTCNNLIHDIAEKILASVKHDGEAC